MACTEIITGRYYKLDAVGLVARATLCQFCNGRKVLKYSECLFRGRGRVDWYKPGIGKNNIFSCQAKHYSNLVEITEDEYVFLKTEKTL